MGNFSTYINIVNKSNKRLKCESYNSIHGSYKSKPSGIIEGSGTTKFQLKNNFGFYGTQGNSTYQILDPEGGSNSKIKFCYECPFGTDDNYVTLETNFLRPTDLLDVRTYGVSEDHSYLSKVPESSSGDVCKRGHPLSGVCVISSPLTAGWDLIFSITILQIGIIFKELFNIAKILPDTFIFTDHGDPQISISEKKKSSHLIDLLFSVSKNKIEISIKLTLDLTNIKFRLDRSGRVRGNIIDCDLVDEIQLHHSNFEKNRDGVAILKKEILDAFNIWENNLNELVFDNIVDKELLKGELPNNDKITYKFITRLNRKSPSSSFISFAASLSKVEGEYDLAKEIIPSKCDYSILVSNHLLMTNALKHLQKLLTKEDRFDFPLALDLGYPYSIYNREALAIDNIDNVWLKVERSAVQCRCDLNGNIRLDLPVSYWNIETVMVHRTMDIVIKAFFTIEDGKINLNFEYEVPKQKTIFTGSIIQKKVIEILKKLKTIEFSILGLEATHLNLISSLHIAGKCKVDKSKIIKE